VVSAANGADCALAVSFNRFSYSPKKLHILATNSSFACTQEQRYQQRSRSGARVKEGPGVGEAGASELGI